MGVDTIKLKEIDCDIEYQIRKDINAIAVKEYTDVLKNSDTNPFPPLVLEKKTNKIIDGFTRFSAYRKALSLNDTINIIYKSFNSNKDRIFFAAKTNDSNGYRLDSFNKKCILNRLLNEGATYDEIYSHLGWAKELESTGYDFNKLATGETLLVQKAVKQKYSKKVKGNKTKNRTEIEVEVPSVISLNKDEAIVNGKFQPLKHGLSHLAGKNVSPVVYANIHKSYRGLSEVKIISEVTMRIKDGTLNIDNEKVVSALHELYDELTILINKL